MDQIDCPWRFHHCKIFSSFHSLPPPYLSSPSPLALSFCRSRIVCRTKNKIYIWHNNTKLRKIPCQIKRVIKRSRSFAANSSVGNGRARKPLNQHSKPNANERVKVTKTCVDRCGDVHVATHKRIN